jgi:hypothetical protein
MNEPINAGRQSLKALVGSAFLGALLSSGVVTFIGEQLAAWRAELIVQEVRAEFQRQEQVTEWKRQSLALLVAPVVMPLDRTRRAFLRYEANNRFLESEILYKGSLAFRDMLLGNGHLIPEDLREVSGRLIEHYDRWLEEYERVRGDRKLAPDEPFVFAGPKGYPFPQGADKLFAQAYDGLVSELYGASARDTGLM